MMNIIKPSQHYDHLSNLIQKSLGVTIWISIYKTMERRDSILLVRFSL